MIRVWLGVDDDDLAGAELLVQDLLGERILDQALDRTTQWTCSELRVVALDSQMLLCALGQLDAEALALELAGQALGHQIDHLHHLALGEFVEHHDIVDAVEELGTEVALERFHHLVLHPLVTDRFVVAGEADIGLAQIRRAEVRRHDQDRVAEVHCATLAVREATFFQDLEERVEHVRVGLFDLVEQHHAERLAPHGFGQLATLFVSDVAGGSTDETADGVLLHVLGHVERDQRLVVAEQELGEGLGEFGLADAGRPEEDERTAGATWVLQACACASDALADGLDRHFLADDPLVQFGFHVEQLGGLFLGQLVDRDTGPDAEHFGHGLFVHLVEQVDTAGLDFGLFGGLLLEQRLLLIAEASSFFEALFFDSLLLGFLDLGQTGLHLLQIWRCAHPLDAQARAGFVDQVDCLVGKVTVADVPIGQVRRGNERLVGDGHPVMGLVLVANALEDLDRVGHCRLFDFDRLESPLEGSVFFEVLAILVRRGCTDGLQFTTSQHRLEDGGSVDRAFGCTCADERVYLVDEQHDVAAGLDLFEHLLQALFEVAAVTATGDECAEIERVQLLVAQRVRDVAGDDLLGQAFDDRGLADARLADQHGVVLGAPTEDLHDPLELARTADHGIELLLTGELGQIATELIEDLAVALVAGVLLARGTAGRSCSLWLAGLALTALVAG